MNRIFHHFILITGILILFQTASFSFAGTGSGHFVGNGGEVFRINGRIFLRDLYEGGVHLNPYVGADIDPTLARRLDYSAKIQTLVNFGVDKNLLAKKLTDLNNLRPSLGHYVLSAIEFYQWQKVSSPLGRLNDATPVLDIPDEDRFVVANRLMNSIRLSNAPDLPLWDLLDATGKVALLIHEGLYSLTQVHCENGEIQKCSQDPLFAREVVAAAFSENHMDFEHAKSLMLNFDLPVDVDICKHESSATADVSVKSDSSMGRPRVMARLENPYSRRERLQFVEQVCKNPERLALPKDAELFIGMNRLGYKVLDLQFVSAVAGEKQIHLSLLERMPTTHRQLYAAVPPEACMTILSDMLRAWFDESGPASHDRMSYCQMASKFRPSSP